MNEKIEKYIKGMKSGDRLCLAKVITIIESSAIKHKIIKNEIIDKIASISRNTIRIGITGVPGAGKSTFIESFGLMLVEKGYKLAVLTIDPSSNISGGSIMADKTRMEKLSSHPNVFIRPSPSSGSLGGVSNMTRETSFACEFAGFNIIIIETVGVGQSEISVASMVDFFLVLMLSNAGDELQGIKKGILEIANAIVVNKADGSNILMAKETKRMYERALKTSIFTNDKWFAPVLTCSSILSIGLEEIWEQICLYRDRMKANETFFEKRQNQFIDWMLFSIKNEINDLFFETFEVKIEMKKIIQKIRNGVESPLSGMQKLLSVFKKSLSKSEF